MRLARHTFWWLVLACWPAAATAHPITNDNHHRTITLSISANAPTACVTVRLSYRLEMDERVAQLEAFDRLRNRPELLRAPDPRTALFTAWGQLLGPDFARGLEVQMDRKRTPLNFISMRPRFTDDDGNDLQHLRCDFDFEGTAPWRQGDWQDLSFHDGTYDKDSPWPADRGQIKIELGSGQSIELIAKKATDQNLIASPAEKLDDDQYQQLRDVSARFRATGLADTEVPLTGPSGTASNDHAEKTLVSLLLDTRQGFFILCCMAFVLGAFHALQPGHGKTLVAAYLVGERGTVWHAVLLGVTTTLTHTGAVLILALVLAVYPLPFTHRQLETSLGMIMGLLIAGLGAWLLLQRLSGRADHVHLGGHGHDHTHGRHDHHHPGAHNHDHDHAHGHGTGRHTSWLGLLLLGIQGGLVPCWDAVVMLLFAVGANLMRLALPLLLAFSAGLAMVLVMLGIVVVQAKGLVGARWGESRLFKSLPYLSAVAITVIGLALCYQSVHR